MTGEKNYFICRNEDCKTETINPEDKLQGGKVVDYISSEKDPTFDCKHCKTKYREENGIILLVFEDEKVIESENDFKSLNSQYETNRIHFTKLVLKNIKELDYNGRTFLFNKCHIDDLVIEDIEIESPYYPIIFSECNIGNIRITKSKISKANRNTPKSLWSFFGMVFFQTKIVQSFTINDCETSIAISGCSVNCAIDISKKSKVDLAMIHSQQKPELKEDAESEDPKSIEELHIDPDSKNESILENCSIGKLIFEEGASIKGKLVFKNCLIESIQGEPYCFEQDLVFLNCTFKDELILKRLSFKKSLIIEICTFEANATFSEIKIEEDIYINYSAFMEGLLVSNVKCGGYIKCQINTIKHKTRFEDNVVAKDISFKFINSDNSITLYRNEITGYLLLNHSDTKGELHIHMLYADVLEIEDFTIGSSVTLEQSVLKNEVRIRRMDVKEAVKFSLTKVGILFNLHRSSFRKTVTAKFLEARVNNFANIEVKGSTTFSSCTFDKQTTSQNLLHGPLLWDTMHAYNSSFNNNYFLDDFLIQKCKIEDSLKFEGNKFKKLYSFCDNTVLGSLTYRTADLKEKEAVIHNSFSMNVLIQRNQLNFISMEDAKVLSTLYFDNNTVQGTLQFGKRELSQSDTQMVFPEAISITKNNIRKTLFHNLHFISPVFMWYNNFDGDLTFRDVVHSNTLDFTGSFVGGSFLFHNSKAKNDIGDLILDNVFNDKRISFTDYIPASFSFINATFNGFEIPQNWKMRGKKLIDKNRRGPRKAFVLKEDILKKVNIKERKFPYSLLKEHYESNKVLQEISDQWKYLNESIFSNGDNLKKLNNTHNGEDIIKDADRIRNNKKLIDKCISKSFTPVYYALFSDNELESLKQTANHFVTTENSYKDAEAIETYNRLKKFFSSFNKVVNSFKNHTLIKGGKLCKKDKKAYKHDINNRLQEQYSVLRHIYRSNGELKEEDSAYYKWMHYKNIDDMQNAPLWLKPKYWIKKFLYEWVFGWGVDLLRILISTGILVIIFAVIYCLMFKFIPGLKIEWDGSEVPGSNIGFFRSLVFALQTTFSALLGDWAPIKAGLIKIPMTINAVLGVLFVTFLIGAYGRKMLR